MDLNTSMEINHIEEYLEAAQTYGHGPTFLDKFNSDGHSHYCQDLPFYLFSLRDEWELACFLLCSDLSMAMLDKFFKLALVCHVFLFYFGPLLHCFFYQIKQLSLSFNSAKMLHAFSEMLISSPPWKYKVWEI